MYCSNGSVILILLGVTVTIVAATFDPNHICTLLVDGTKIKDPRACDVWIQCVNDEPVSGTCGADLVYDRETGDCVASDSIKCISSNPCAPAPTELFMPDPYSCSGYYFCQNGVGTRGNCGEGMNYNPGTQTCIRNFPCQEKMNPDNYCNIVPDGVFIKDATNCNGWQLCWKGVVMNGTCPGTFFFNAAQAECDYPQKVGCAITEPPPIIAEPDECTKAGDFVTDGSTCNGYYYCREDADGQMRLEHGECAVGRFFYAANGGACVPRAQVSCSYDRCSGLGNTTIQLANKSNDGCTGYTICQDGTAISSGSCPSDEYFDELTQRCTTQLISYPACALSTEATTQLDLVNDDE